MDRVNLFVVGAAKSGTTSIHHYLSRHPDIFMSLVKEPHFFAKVESHNIEAYEKPKEGVRYHNKVIRDSEIYHGLFRNAEKYIYRGEASPSYLWDSDTAQKIYEYNADAKIIAILREPTERAFAHYQMAFQTGVEQSKNFLKAIESDQNKENKGWGKSHLYLELGFYYEQLSRYSEKFRPEQILIITTKDLQKKPIETRDSIFRFLGLDETVADFEMEKKNPARAARFSWIPKLKQSLAVQYAKKAIPTNMRYVFKNLLYKESSNKLTMNEETRIYLEGVYKEDVSLLQNKYNIRF